MLVLFYIIGTDYDSLFLGMVTVLLSSSIIWDLCLQKSLPTKSSTLLLLARFIICGILIWFGSYFTSFISSICLVLVTIILLTSEIQQEIVPSICPIFHNPLKAKIRNSKSSFVAYVAYLLGSLHLSCRFLAPIFITVWITSSWLWPNGKYIPNGPYYGVVDYLVYGIIYHRALRYTWQNIYGMAIDIYIMCIFKSFDNNFWTMQTRGLIFEPINLMRTPGFQKIDIELLFVISFFRQVIVRFMAKFWFWILSFYNFLTSKKHVLNQWYIYLIPAIIISPISITLSAFLNAPVMPLLGLPIFWMGFCRPKRMWPNIGKLFCSYIRESMLYWR